MGQCMSTMLFTLWHINKFGDSTLQVKVFANQVASFKIVGAMATKMVATWRVVAQIWNRLNTDNGLGYSKSWNFRLKLVKLA